MVGCTSPPRLLGIAAIKSTPFAAHRLVPLKRFSNVVKSLVTLVNLPTGKLSTALQRTPKPRIHLSWPHLPAAGAGSTVLLTLTFAFVGVRKTSVSKIPTYYFVAPAKWSYTAAQSIRGNTDGSTNRRASSSRTLEPNMTGRRPPWRPTKETI